MADKMFGLTKAEFFGEFEARMTAANAKLEKKVMTSLASEIGKLRTSVDAQTSLVTAMKGDVSKLSTDMRLQFARQRLEAHEHERGLSELINHRLLLSPVRGASAASPQKSVTVMEVSQFYKDVGFHLDVESFGKSGFRLAVPRTLPSATKARVLQIRQMNTELKSALGLMARPEVTWGLDQFRKRARAFFAHVRTKKEHQSLGYFARHGKLSVDDLYVGHEALFPHDPVHYDKLVQAMSVAIAKKPEVVGPYGALGDVLLEILAIESSEATM